MRRYILAAVCIGVGLPAGAGAQSAMLNLPRSSQQARASQRIGITDITIDYSRPLANGRKIFGGLVAYGQVWRAGANENTTIEFSDTVTIEGKPLAKGVYGLHMIPGETSWVLIFSKNSTSWGSFTYSQAEDALRVTVTPCAAENQEALSYSFDNPKPDSVVVTMRWAKVAVPFRVAVDTPEIAAASLRRQLRGRPGFEWQPWVEAANYLLDHKLSADEAVKDADRSIEIEDHFEGEIAWARALSALGRKTEALAARDKALAMGTQPQVHDYARAVQMQGREEEALELFRINIRKDPNSWVGHNEAARLEVANGDYAAAVQEMKLALAVSPEYLKDQHRDLIRRLENRMDINH